MPINDPIRDRKIAPNSLAFPTTGRRGAVSSSTYQSTVQTIVNNTVVYADSEVQNNDRHALATADRDSEYRSKSWVSGWHRVVDWDITVDQNFKNNEWDPVRFSNEAMRAIGAYQTSTQWAWKVPPGWEGTYFIYSFVCVKAANAAAVGSGKLGIIVNGTLRTVIDRLDAEMTGDGTFVNDCILRGGRNISVDVGDVVQIALWLGGGIGDAEYLHPSSVVGYVSGFRTMCGFDHIINSQDDLNGYTFA